MPSPLAWSSSGRRAVPRLTVPDRAGRRVTFVPVSCCVCGRSDAVQVAAGQDYEYETTADEFRVVRCFGCGLHYLNPRPSMADLPVIYPPTYYAYNYETQVSSISRKAKEWLDARRARDWLSVASTQRPRFLDVGCGDGRYLHMFHGWSVPKEHLWGTELDEKVVSRINEDGYQVRYGPVEEIRDLPESFFDLIVMLQVLEHVADPPAVVERLTKLLAPKGILVIETPSTESLDFRLFGRRYWGGYHFPRHWNWFDRATLSRLVTELGLEVARVRYIPAPSFWGYSFHHVVKYAWGCPRLARLCNPLQHAWSAAFATSFDLFRAALGGATSNIQLIARRAA